MRLEDIERSKTGSIRRWWDGISRFFLLFHLIAGPSFLLPFYRGYDLDFPAMLCEIAEGELLHINLTKRGNNI